MRTERAMKTTKIEFLFVNPTHKPTPADPLFHICFAVSENANSPRSSSARTSAIDSRSLRSAIIADNGARLMRTPSSAHNRQPRGTAAPISRKARRITARPALNPQTATVFPFPENPQNIGRPRYSGLCQGKKSRPKNRSRPPTAFTISAGAHFASSIGQYPPQVTASFSSRGDSTAISPSGDFPHRPSQTPSA